MQGFDRFANNFHACPYTAFLTLFGRTRFTGGVALVRVKRSRFFALFIFSRRYRETFGSMMRHFHFFALIGGHTLK